MTHRGRSVRIGADIGGTFTDIAMEVGHKTFSTKVLTTYSAPEQAILDGIGRVCRDAGIETRQIDIIIHGTTLAANALIERKGAKTAFLTTKGFRDVIEMRTENRFEQYDLNIILPSPLVPRNHRFVAGGRIAASGREMEPLDEDSIASLARQLIERDFESLAIGFLHSYVNPAHELRAREIIAALAPQISISISCEVSPQMREFERFNTVCSNAFVRPVMESYLSRLADSLKSIGANCPVFMIHSGGGLISVETATRFPVRLLESGPAGGAIFAADVATRYDIDQVLSFDMGGTTAKICLIENQTPKTARTFEVARTYRFKKGSGMPISIPAIDMVEIGAGGGSVAHVDGMNQIRVGPESAGSEPGPACYQRGGTHPTVTDANLLLGRLDPGNFAGGDIALSTDSAAAALRKAIGDKLHVALQTAAVGICEMVDENMANAARVHAVESGKELSSFTMVAFGGGAPLHATRLCEKLGISKILVPPGAGVGSAIGFLRAPFGYEAVQGAYLRLSQFDPMVVNTLLQSLTDEAVEVATTGNEHAKLVIERKAYMRYCGQGWEIPLVLPLEPFGNDGGLALHSLFQAAYAARFGRSLGSLDIEVMGWAVRAVTENPPTTKLAWTASSFPVLAESHRKIYNPRNASFLDAAIVERKSIPIGGFVVGPAAIVERETTTILTDGFEAIMQADGCLLVRRKDSADV
jgi:N-methylhydantoinase A